MDFSSRLGSSCTVTLSASDHVEAVTWGDAGDTGGMYVICIWGVTQMGGKFISKLTILRKSFHVLRLDNSRCRLYEEHLS